MSSTLVTLAEKEASIEGRKLFVDGCKPVWESSTVRHIYHLCTLAKDLTDLCHSLTTILFSMLLRK